MAERKTLDEALDGGAVSLGELRRRGEGITETAEERFALCLVMFVAERLESIDTSLRILAEEAAGQTQVG